MLMVNKNILTDSSKEKHSKTDTHDYNTCACHLPKFLQFAADLMHNKDALVPLIKKMLKAHILDDFMLLLQLVADGTLGADNLPLPLAVKCAKLQNCDATTAMQYRPETLEFWDVFYCTCHGSGLLLASGKKMLDKCSRWNLNQGN